MWHDRCAWVQARLPLMAGDELLGLDRRRVERHLIGCSGCCRRLEALQDTLGILQVAADRSPASSESPSLWPALARQIRESNRPVVAPSWEPRWAPAWPRMVAWSGVAATLLGLLVMARLARDPADPAPGRSTNELAVAPTDPEPAAAFPTSPAGESSARPPASSPRTETVRARRSGRGSSLSIRIESGPTVASKTSDTPSTDSAPPAGFDYNLDSSSPLEGRGEAQQSY